MDDLTIKYSSRYYLNSSCFFHCIYFQAKFVIFSLDKYRITKEGNQLTINRRNNSREYLNNAIQNIE